MTKINLQTGAGMIKKYKGYNIDIIDVGAGKTKIVVNNDDESKMEGIYQICGGGGNNFKSVRAAKEVINNLK
jgi:hypothetical protein